MIKKIVLLLSLSFGLFAHELLLFVEDNKNNTIKVIGEFDTGDSVAGAMVQIKSLISGDILFQQRFDESQEMIVDIPKEPYQVVLDDGSHKIVKAGIEPIGGYSDELKEKVDNTKNVIVVQSNNSESSLTNIFLILCLVLFCLTIYFGFYNTNRILSQVKES